MMDLELLRTRLQERFSGQIEEMVVAHQELTVIVAPDHLHRLCRGLREENGFEFEQMMDITAVDYLDYGKAEWQTEYATSHGFSRATSRDEAVQEAVWDKPRFAVVYHLLSIANNQRLRVKTYIDEGTSLRSVTDIWPGSDWFEREVYDMFGLLFTGHQDLRRILTDYGFVGHPFRKDFPVSGNVEVRYDAKAGRVVYGPVEIEPRVLVPKVIRHDNRYASPQEKEPEHDGNA